MRRPGQTLGIAAVPRWSPRAALAICAIAIGFPANAQELEPRAYRTLPTGLNFFVLSYSYSSGNVLADPTVPLQDLEATINTVGVGYLRSLALFGRSASITAVVPYVQMSASGTLQGEPVSGARSGSADARVRLALNLLGGPALTPAEYASYRQRRNLGVSLSVIAPTGQYDSNHLINFGANRWGFKPEIGYSSIRGPWIFEFAVGAWLFTDNNDFPGGSVREQAPIGSLQAHVSYTFKGGVWVSLDGNYFTGGESTLNGDDKGDAQRTSRTGVTVSIPLRKRHSLKLTAQTGAYTRLGADFDVLTVSYQLMWH